MLDIKIELINFNSFKEIYTTINGVDFGKKE
jgi:hypothetical protein